MWQKAILMIYPKKGYIDVVKDMYEGAATTVRSKVGETSKFPIAVRIHQASA